MMKRFLALGVIISTAAVFAEIEEWKNPQVNSINRLAARTYSMPLADEKDALTDALEPTTPYKLSLNGEWRFRWVGDPARRPTDFYKTDFDDSAWTTIDVPSCVEMRGYGVPGYTNVRYPHADKSNPKEPHFAEILDRDAGTADYNPVSSYRRTFTVPEMWKNREVILRFDGVYSAFYVYINGKMVGYAEDSKLPSEFRITDFLQEGENLLCVQVFRWCDGSYLEDQDMNRFSGIFRDVTLWSAPKGGLWDFTVHTVPVKGYENWKLIVETEGGTTATLYDADKRKVAELNAKGRDLTLEFSPKLWSAEKPYLYTLVLRRGLDIRSKKVGFKEQKIVGNTVYVNGQPIKFKGVNRHETNPDNGRTVSMTDMLKDITLMKQYNVNTVRTCHYPDHHSWYDLCDKYGLYVIAEANVEGHEPGYGDRGLGRFPEWEHTIVERNVRNCVFYRNNPSVVFWSMGNETGHGDCFRKAIAAVKEIDSAHLVHWERGNVDADIDSSMYPSVEWVEKRGKLGDQKQGSLESAADAGHFAISGHTAGKPYIMCEYAHTMGNALGNFQEYWDVIYRYPALAGGCIWDWVDQAIWKYTDRIDQKTGMRERYLAYGGDWDERPNDGPFNCNGIVDPLRNVGPKLIEVGKVYENLRVSRLENGDFELWNQYGFTFADEFDGTWELIADGIKAGAGKVTIPHIAPLTKGVIVPEGFADALATIGTNSEVFINFEFTTRDETIYAKRGWTVSREQVAIAGGFKGVEIPEAGDAPFGVDEERDLVTFERGRTTAIFSRSTGTLRTLVMKGLTVISDPDLGLAAGPRLTCMRAFTDNDHWMRSGSWGKASIGCESTGMTQLRYHPDPIVVTGNVVRTRVFVDGAKGAGFLHECDWHFASDGSITLDNRVTPYGRMPEALPRLGLSMRLAPRLEQMTWYGRGPEENYIDRCTSCFFGIWKSTVTEQFVPYVRPQDCGYKSDVRWAEFRDRLGRGVRFTADVPLYMQALHYSWEDLEFARHLNGGRRMNTPLVTQSEILLNLDVRQFGLGGASCGPGPMDKYRFNPNEPVAWKLKLEFVK